MASGRVSTYLPTYLYLPTHVCQSMMHFDTEEDPPVVLSTQLCDHFVLLLGHDLDGGLLTSSSAREVDRASINNEQLGPPLEMAGKTLGQRILCRG